MLIPARTAPNSGCPRARVGITVTVPIPSRFARSQTLMVPPVMTKGVCAGVAAGHVDTGGRLVTNCTVLGGLGVPKDPGPLMA